MAEAERALEVLGGRFMRKEDPPREIFPLDHKLIYIGKIKSTGSKFPRKAELRQKIPLNREEERFLFYGYLFYKNGHAGTIYL